MSLLTHPVHRTRTGLLHPHAATTAIAFSVYKLRQQPSKPLKANQAAQAIPQRLAPPTSTAFVVLSRSTKLSTSTHDASVHAFKAEVFVRVEGVYGANEWWYPSPATPWG